MALLSRLDLCAAAVVATIAACASSPPPQPPRLSFAAASYDFGTVEQGAPIEAAFALRNAGGSELSVHHLKSACGCAATLAARTVPAGGGGVINVRCDSARASGSISRTVTVYSNDPAQPFATLTLRGTVAAEIAADPPALYLGALRRAERGQNQVRIVSRRPLRLSLRPDAGPVLEASLVDSPAAPAEKTLALSVKADAPLGRFSTAVVIATDSPRHPTLNVPVTGMVVAEKE
ncbi:MAG: DUF1573 domain-containing protein [Deltaproteobacteria bacterium]|nr:DUF1573 domain-containing protein [Deltaproteobacteria bacterium]